MAVFHEKDFKQVTPQMPGADSVSKRAVISPNEGWQGAVMRIFELGEGGYSPKHSHPWYHVNYVIEGTGIVHYDGEDYEVEPGSCAYIPEDIIHQFRNTGKGKLKFICIVPEEGDK